MSTPLEPGFYLSNTCRRLSTATVSICEALKFPVPLGPRRIHGRAVGERPQRGNEPAPLGRGPAACPRPCACAAARAFPCVGGRRTALSGRGAADSDGSGGHAPRRRKTSACQRRSRSVGRAAAPPTQEGAGIPASSGRLHKRRGGFCACVTSRFPAAPAAPLYNRHPGGEALYIQWPPPTTADPVQPFVTHFK